MKTREGKTVSIALTSDTEYQGQGGEDSRRDIKLGDRVVVKAMGEGVDLSADEVRFSHAGGRENSGQSDVESPRRHSRPSDYDDDAASDSQLRGHRLFAVPELDGVVLHPPIQRFLRRWRPGDPVAYLGALWVP